MSPRKDGSPTIAEMIGEDPEDAPPTEFALAERVRVKDGPSWKYGAILDRLADDHYRIQFLDGFEITLVAQSIYSLEWPRDPDKPWPLEEDCTHCPGRSGDNGTHKFGCALRGARQVRLNAVKNPDGTFTVKT